MSLGTPNRGVEIFVHERMVKQAEQKFDAQNPRDGLVQRGFGNPAAFYTVDDGVLKSLMVEIIKLHVHAGIERQQNGIGGESTT